MAQISTTYAQIIKIDFAEPILKLKVLINAQGMPLPEKITFEAFKIKLS